MRLDAAHARPEAAQCEHPWQEPLNLRLCSRHREHSNPTIDYAHATVNNLIPILFRMWFRWPIQLKDVINKWEGKEEDRKLFPMYPSPVMNLNDAELAQLGLTTEALIYNCM
eukprot:COSAG02_NODE_21593_length_782_cov_0.879941_1_plen_112_part_00